MENKSHSVQGKLWEICSWIKCHFSHFPTCGFFPLGFWFGFFFGKCMRSFVCLSQGLLAHVALKLIRFLWVSAFILAHLLCKGALADLLHLKQTPSLSGINCILLRLPSLLSCVKDSNNLGGSQSYLCDFSWCEHAHRFACFLSHSLKNLFWPLGAVMPGSNVGCSSLAEVWKQMRKH